MRLLSIIFNDTIILFELLIELVLLFEYLLRSSRSAPEPVLKLQMVSARAHLIYIYCETLFLGIDSKADTPFYDSFWCCVKPCIQASF